MTNVKWYGVIDYTVTCDECGKQHIKSEGIFQFKETSDGVEFRCEWDECAKMNWIRWDDFDSEYE